MPKNSSDEDGEDSAADEKSYLVRLREKKEQQKKKHDRQKSEAADKNVRQRNRVSYTERSEKSSESSKDESDEKSERKSAPVLNNSLSKKRKIKASNSKTNAKPTSQGYNDDSDTDSEINKKRIKVSAKSIRKRSTSVSSSDACEDVVKKGKTIASNKKLKISEETSGSETNNSGHDSESDSKIKKKSKKPNKSGQSSSDESKSSTTDKEKNKSRVLKAKANLSTKSTEDNNSTTENSNSDSDHKSTKIPKDSNCTSTTVEKNRDLERHSSESNDGEETKNKKNIQKIKSAKENKKSTKVLETDTDSSDCEPDSDHKAKVKTHRSKEKISEDNNRDDEDSETSKSSNSDNDSDSDIKGKKNHRETMTKSIQRRKEKPTKDKSKDKKNVACETSKSEDDSNSDLEIKRVTNKAKSSSNVAPGKRNRKVDNDDVILKTSNSEDDSDGKVSKKAVKSNEKKKNANVKGKVGNVYKGKSNVTKKFITKSKNEESSSELSDSEDDSDSDYKATIRSKIKTRKIQKRKVISNSAKTTVSKNKGQRDTSASSHSELDSDSDHKTKKNPRKSIQKVNILNRKPPGKKTKVKTDDEELSKTSNSEDDSDCTVSRSATNESHHNANSGRRDKTVKDGNRNMHKSKPRNSSKVVIKSKNEESSSELSDSEDDSDSDYKATISDKIKTRKIPKRKVISNTSNTTVSKNKGQRDTTSASSHSELDSDSDHKAKKNPCKSIQKVNILNRKPPVKKTKVKTDEELSKTSNSEDDSDCTVSRSATNESHRNTNSGTRDKSVKDRNRNMHKSKPRNSSKVVMKSKNEESETSNSEDESNFDPKVNKGKTSSGKKTSNIQKRKVSNKKTSRGKHDEASENSHSGHDSASDRKVKDNPPKTVQRVNILNRKPPGKKAKVVSDDEASKTSKSEGDSDYNNVKRSKNSNTKSIKGGKKLTATKSKVDYELTSDASHSEDDSGSENEGRRNRGRGSKGLSDKKQNTTGSGRAQRGSKIKATLNIKKIIKDKSSGSENASDDSANKIKTNSHKMTNNTESNKRKIRDRKNSHSSDEEENSKQTLKNGYQRSSTGTISKGKKVKNGSAREKAKNDSSENSNSESDSQSQRNNKKGTSGNVKTSDNSSDSEVNESSKERQKTEPLPDVMKEVKIVLEKLDLTDKAIKLLMTKNKRKDNKSSSESEQSKGSSNSDSDFKKDKRKNRKPTKATTSKSMATRKGKAHRERNRSLSISVDEDGYECRRSGRANKYVIKKREEPVKTQSKWKRKIKYDDDEDFTASESATSDDNSDPDYMVAKEKKRSKPANRKNRKHKKGTSSSSSEDEKQHNSPNASDEEFERLLRASSKDESDSEDSSSNKYRKNKQRGMEFAKTINGSGSQVKLTDGYKSYCRCCKGGGLLVCCLSCNSSYHLGCLEPPLKNVPAGSWECPQCTAEPLPGKVAKILSWRWVKGSRPRFQNTSKSNQSADKKSKGKREFFVLWAEQSYWKCSWVSEFHLDMYHKNRLVFFKRDYLDDLQEEETTLGDESDPLYQRFYRYGIHPDWLNIQRIINVRQNDDKTQYLVKWRGVPYTHVTWEDEDEDEIPDFQKFKDIYHEWRMSFTGDTIYKTRQRFTRDEIQNFSFKYINKPPKTPSTDLEIEYEGQPSFVDTDNGLSLHDYQLDSLHWLRKSWNAGKNTILADEMGLGKTIQAIMFIYSLFKEGHSRGPFFVTAPLSTIANWEREFELWAPDLYVVTYAGVSEEREVIREHEISYCKGATAPGKLAKKVRGAVKFHVLLTSYEFIGRDIECLSSIKWAVIIVDEAHRLKCLDAKFFHDLEQYEGDYKLLLTGTPLQNNVTELFNILRYILPDRIGKLNSLEKEFESDTVSNEKHEERVVKLKDMLEPHLLRRVKENVLKDLPTKCEVVVKVELSPMQQKYYRFILTKNFEGLNSRSGGHWATLMTVFVDLQKCCNHPYLFSTAMVEAPVMENDIYETSALVAASGKLSLLQKMLKKLKEGGSRVLIFSHYTKMLDILEDFLDGEKYEHERIDGKITGTERQAAIDRFNAPDSTIFVFMLSTKAGGLGINLATADTVILYDSDWNPHNDIQALSRAHRIGQTKKVMIYRFLTRNSIEERIAEVARSKLMLNHVVLEAGKGAMKFALSKTALDNIIRHGTLELFKEGRNVRDNFTDKDIEELLDRSQYGIDQKEDISDGSPNDIFSSVKIVSCVKKDDNDAVEENGVKESEITAKDYWNQLLGPMCDRKDKKTEPELLGKRVTKKINYKDSMHGVKPTGDLPSLPESSSESEKQKRSESDCEILSSGESDSSTSVTSVPVQSKNKQGKASGKAESSLDRKSNSVWEQFIHSKLKKSEPAICKRCFKKVSPQAAKLSRHLEKCKNRKK